jgi:outer membrane protein, multidrug efflux system
MNENKTIIMKHHRYKYLLSLFLIVVVASCSVNKEYQSPEIDLPAEFDNTSFADTSSIADIEWKKFFTDTRLQALIDSGLAKNHDLQIAVKNIEIAQRQLLRAKALNLPEIDLRLNAQYYRLSNNSLNGLSTKTFLGKSHVENYLTTATVSWEIDVWGKIKAQKGAALAQYLQTYEGKKAVQTELVAGIAQGYFNLLMLDKQLEIARKNLVLNDSFLVATRLLKDAGVTNALAVQQAEAQRQNTSLLIPQLEQSRFLQENALQLLTGQLPGGVARSSSLNLLNLPTQLGTGLPAAMVSRRPDVRQNELSLIIAHAQVGIAKANMYPTLSLTAGVGVEAFKASNWWNVPTSLFGLAAGTIAQPIFKRRELKTKWEVSKLEREQAVIRFRQSVLGAVTEVSNALIQIEKLKEQEQIAASQVDTLNSSINNAQLLFKSDLANYLEVITAQSNALQAQLNLSSIQRQEWGAVVELYRSLGGGWK